MLRIYLLNYNYGKYVGEAVQSLISQTDQDFAVTCIDNGSNDGSDKYLRDVCAERGWKFEEFPNLPVSNIANHIAQTSSEPFITRLDADDVLCSDFVALVKKVIAEEEPDIVYGNYHLMDFDGEVFSTQKILPRGKAPGVPIHDEPFHGACTVIRREELLAVGGYYSQFSRNDGFDLYLKFRTKSLSHISEPIFQYRRGHRSMSGNKASLFEARINMIAAYAAEKGLSAGDDVMHILAFPNHPEFYRGDSFKQHREFAQGWGRNARLIARDEAGEGPDLIPWSRVNGFGDLRQFLDESSEFDGISTLVVHSMSAPLAPLQFFEIAPIALNLFESNSVISGVKLESSLYWTRSGGVSRQENSRTLFEENRVVLHSGGLTAFRRGSDRDSIATLLEVSNDMLVEGHC